MPRPYRPRRPERGFALLAILSLLVAGVLYFLVNWAGPDLLNAYRAHKTEAALAEAKDALIGYALRHRDRQMAQSPPIFDVYGYLPMPDLGESQNKNSLLGLPCSTEGCAKQNNAGTFGTYTYIGRFPWKTLALEPLRDGYGECLWYAVSASHKDIENPGTMNWDTLGQLDVVIANGNNNLTSIVASAHDRPVAIIFSPGVALPNQNRGNLGGDDVTQCGGNYDVANYLDPDTAGALGAVTNFFGGSTNNASGDTSAVAKALSTEGAIYKRGDNTLWPNACPSGANCTLAANDKGLVLSPDVVFGAIRKSSGFRTDINSMLDQMVTCLRDQMASGGAFIPVNIGPLLVADKSVGRLKNDSCYDNTPPGYFNHWRDHFFVAKPAAGTFNVTVDGALQACNGVLIFANQRGPGQSRIAALGEQDLPANYLEGVNLASFTAPGIDFAGPSLLDIVSPTQTVQQDIVRCVPTTTSMQTVNPPTLVDSGGDTLNPMATYDPGTRTLTLGSENATTGNGVAAGSLFGCAWTAEAIARGQGFRSYFTFRFMGITGGVGNNGFVFAMIDGESNGTGVCGAAGSHLGYSGDNGITPPLAFPKIGIEFDQGRNVGPISTALNSGRNDPCGTTPTGPPPPGCSPPYVGYNSHSAIVYWGDRALNYDDNVHGAGTPPADPRNPDNLAASPPGIAFVNYRGAEDVNGDGTLDSYLYHVRVEVTPTRAVNSGAAELSNTVFSTRVWIVRDSPTDAQLIAAMQNTSRPMAQLYSGADPTLADTATVYDVGGGTCSGGCPASQTCGSDNICYRPGLKSVRLGFTGSQRTQDQQVLISNFLTSWLQ